MPKTLRIRLNEYNLDSRVVLICQEFLFDEENKPGL